MYNITKTETLDACVDGNVTNLQYLLGEQGYCQFNVFYEIVKRIKAEDPNVSFSFINDTESTFEVLCELSDESFTELRKEYQKRVLFNKIPGGIELRITTK